MNFLENNIIKLRAPELSDIDFLYTWENDPSVWQVSNTLTPFSRFTLAKYIESSHLDIYEAKQLRLMIDAKINSNEKETIGTVDLFDFEPFHGRAGVGILIKEGKRRKGYASEALNLVIMYAFKVLSLHQLYSNITSDNDASLHLFQEKGFIITGEKKEWIKNQESWKNELTLQLINQS